MRNRIVGFTLEPPEDLCAHPYNARAHPAPQREALAEVLDRVGWIGAVIQNDRTGFLIDGHARVEHALSTGERLIPVLHVDLTEDEELLMLGVYDPISAMARYDQERLDMLLSEITPTDTILDAILDSLSKPAKPDDVPSPLTVDDGTEFRTISVTYTVDRYEEIQAALPHIPGGSDAEKIHYAVTRHTLTGRDD